jgi:hypothetical protein
MVGIGRHIGRLPGRRTGLPFTTRGGGLQAETKTYIDGLATPLSSAQLKLIDTFVKDLKSGLGISALSEVFDVMYILAGETSESSLRNLVKRAHDATAVNSPTFTALEGFKKNGTASYLNSNWNGRTAGHANAYSLNSASFGIYFRTNTDATAMEFHGAWSTTADGGADNRLQMSRPNGHSTNYGVGVNSLAEANSIDERIAGMLVLSRTASNIQKLYMNKIVKVEGAEVTTKIPNQNVMLLALISGDTSVYFFENDQISFGFLGKGLTPTDVGIITDTFEAYMDSNNKGVIS